MGFPSLVAIFSYPPPGHISTKGRLFVGDSCKNKSSLPLGEISLGKETVRTIKSNHPFWDSVSFSIKVSTDSKAFIGV